VVNCSFLPTFKTVEKTKMGKTKSNNLNMQYLIN